MRQIIILALVLASAICFAQDYPRQDVDFSAIADELIAYQDEDLQYDDILENYIHLFDHPIDLNATSPENLRATNLLSEKQIENLHTHIKTHGRLLSVYELQAIQEFDMTTIRKLLPFVVVESESAYVNAAFVRRFLKNNSSYLLSRYERSLVKSSSYSGNDSLRRFAGSPDKLYLRYRNSLPNDFSVGFTGEKDPGEQMHFAPAKYYYGFDYISAHAQLKNKKYFSNLIVGDYRVQFGQGLILGNSFGLGKGGETITSVKRPAGGFVPYTSASENGFLRGVALSVPLVQHLEASAFFSATRRDANVAGEDLSFSGFLNSGSHRSIVEQETRKTVPEQKAGFVLSYRRNLLDAGIIAEGTHYDIPVLKNPNAYNQHAFTGNELLNFSTYFNYTVRNINVFGEVGKSWNHGQGIVAGALMSLSREFDMALLFRNYAANFLALNGNAFSENTIAQNEQGFYWGLKYRFNRRFTLAGYIDLFRFPWLKYRTYSPSEGHETLLKFVYTPSRKSTVFLQGRLEAKARNNASADYVYKTSTGIRHNLAGVFDSEIAPHVKLKVRIQYSSYDFDNMVTSGFAVTQDITFSLSQFRISLRHSLFETDDYENRQYVHERDVWLAYSLPAYHGKGIRNVIVVEYKARRDLTLSTKISRSYFKDTEEIVTSGETTKGNQLNHIKLQAKFSF